MHRDKHQYGTEEPRVPSTLGKFIESLKADGEEYHYLTTQYAAEGDDDAITVFPPPTQALLDDVAVAPKLMGNLVLQQVNLWLGKSREGSTSGLVSKICALLFFVNFSLASVAP